MQISLHTEVTWPNWLTINSAINRVHSYEEKNTKGLHSFYPLIRAIPLRLFLSIHSHKFLPTSQYWISKPNPERLDSETLVGHPSTTFLFNGPTGPYGMRCGSNWSSRKQTCYGREGGTRTACTHRLVNECMMRSLLPQYDTRERPCVFLVNEGPFKGQFREFPQKRLSIGRPRR